MSLYNMVFGKNPAADVILSTLGLTQGDFGRFRDALVADGKVCVYTRCGGGNRDDYEPVFERMRAHPDFDSDEDDDFDCTYCTFRFRLPEAFAADLKALEAGAPFDPSKRWLEMIKALRAAPK